MNILDVWGTRLFVLELSIYDVCLWDYFGCDGCAGTYTIVTDAVSKTTLGVGAGWGAITGDFGVSSNGDVG